MFSTAIGSTPLCCEAADAFFDDKITLSNTFENDDDATFLSTLRALVAPRMEPNDRLFLKLWIPQEIADSGSKYRADKIFGDFFPNQDNTIFVIKVRLPESFEFAVKEFQKQYSGWTKLERVTAFFRKHFQVVCYIQPEQKSVAIIMEYKKYEYMHYLQSAIPVFLPWYFNPKDKLDELEMRLLESLQEKTPNKYMAAIAEIEKRFDIRTKFIQKKLADFELKYEKEKYESIKDETKRLDTKIKQLNEQIRREILKLRDYKITLLGLEEKFAGNCENSELAEYFLCNKKLRLVMVDGTKATFVVNDYLAYFDEEMAMKVIANPNSYAYQLTKDADITPDDVKILLKAIFIEQKLRIRFCAAYELQPSNVYGLRDYNFGFEERNCMPNPHINTFACLGNYMIPINKSLAKNDYVEVVEHCVASCKSLNFGDSTVMRRFILTLTHDNGRSKYIESPTGELMTPTGAVEWLRGQEETLNG